MNWCFATVNGKLAEIFFDRKAGKPVIWGHSYIKKEEYKTKREQGWIERETRKFKITYRKKEYFYNDPKHPVQKRKVGEILTSVNGGI